MSKTSCQKPKQELLCRSSKGDKKRRSIKQRKKRAKRRKAYRMLRKQRKLIPKNPICFEFQGRSVMNDNCFWKNYCNVRIWQKTCLQYYNFPNSGLSAPSHDTKYFNQSKNQPTKYEDAEVNDIASDNDCSSSEDSDLQFVVQDDMLKFMEISMRHREEMRLQREKELGNTGLRSERDNIEECLAPQGKSIDAKRLEEMHELYGDSAAKIMGMETALQLTFNRNCDLYKPSYWPILPFKLSFS